MRQNIHINWQDSVTDTIRFSGQNYFLKRDDLLSPISGNKARKLHGLLQQDLNPVQQIISHGGAQSNAMLALAQLSQLLGIPFHYYTRPVPKWLSKNPLGNLRNALDYGMHWHITRDGLPPESEKIHGGKLLIPQGISMPEAQAGFKLLADEIELFCQSHALDDIAVVTPSGTGATALYLQQYLKHVVYTVPCVGNQTLLQGMFQRAVPKAIRYPVILDTKKSYRFGELHPELLNTYHALLEETGVEFELMYDAKTWLALQEHTFNKPVLYLHNGGTSGNESMLARYHRLKNLKHR